jgi:hypothetical protein
MSDLGQHVRRKMDMSAVPLKADMCSALAHVRYGQKRTLAAIRSPHRREQELTAEL